MSESLRFLFNLYGFYQFIKSTGLVMLKSISILVLNIPSSQFLSAIKLKILWFKLSYRLNT